MVNAAGAGMIDLSDSHVVTAAALARLHDYLRRAPACNDTEEMIARDAYVQGFTAGARYLATHTTALSITCNPEFRQAIALLAEVLR